MIIMDTNACIDFLNGKSEVKKILSAQEDIVHITTITVYEISIGLERTKRKISKNRYKELYKTWLKFISSMEILPLGYKEAEKAAKIHDDLLSKGQMIDDNDILIAGIMLSNDIRKIITRNSKHFEKITELNIIKY
ncbi:MAG: putative Ribonuclease VapC [Promethearchaeota archaeon]|nr:MAG: putative Ribonuclease VapC [Candidatus Lokiarchaeota archaeon]